MLDRLASGYYFIVTFSEQQVTREESYQQIHFSVAARSAAAKMACTLIKTS
jgi:hypothetical protein